MRKRYAVLQRIDSDRKISEDKDHAFIYHLQSALLLALREEGILNIMQYRQAEVALKQQRLNRARQILEQERFS